MKTHLQLEFWIRLKCFIRIHYISSVNFKIELKGLQAVLRCKNRFLKGIKTGCVNVGANSEANRDWINSNSFNAKKKIKHLKT